MLRSNNGQQQRAGDTRCQRYTANHRWFAHRQSQPAGRACILRSDEHERELIGRDSHSTNNRMELKAAIEGLLALEETCEVEVVTDSEYLLREVTERLARWKSNG